MIDEKTDKILIYTNPLFYIMVLIAYTYKGYCYLGFHDWIFVLFNKDRNNPKFIEIATVVYKKRGKDMFIIKRLAYRYIIKKK